MEALPNSNRRLRPDVMTPCVRVGFTFAGHRRSLLAIVNPTRGVEYISGGLKFMAVKKNRHKVRKPATGIKIHSLLRHDDLPATVGLVKEVRAELVARMDSIDHKLGSFDQRFEAMDQRFQSMDQRFESIDHRFESIDHRFEAIDHKFEMVRHEAGQVAEKVLSAIHRTQTLMEEQRGENKIVLDGIKLVMERQDRVEGEVAEFRETLRIFVKAKDLG